MVTDLVKRLDDKLDEVRLEAQTALVSFFRFLPPDFSEPAWATTAATLMVHLDDPSLAIREGVQRVLEVAADRRPREVLDLCEEARLKHQSPVHCEALIVRCRAQLAGAATGMVAH